ncbi:MAG TPA: hypothetical protein VI136_14540 [Verrucomicrobiae bacterium]
MTSATQRNQGLSTPASGKQFMTHLRLRHAVRNTTFEARLRSWPVAGALGPLFVGLFLVLLANAGS